MLAAINAHKRKIAQREQKRINARFREKREAEKKRNAQMRKTVVNLRRNR